MVPGNGGGRTVYRSCPAPGIPWNVQRGVRRMLRSQRLRTYELSSSLPQRRRHLPRRRRERGRLHRARVGCGGPDLAFDPSPAAIESLCANIDLNRIADRVSVEPYSIGRSRDNVSVATSGPSAMHHVDTEGSSCLIEMRITYNPWLRTTTCKEQSVRQYSLHSRYRKSEATGRPGQALPGLRTFHLGLLTSQSTLIPIIPLSASVPHYGKRQARPPRP
jgi:hypothetical protein